MANHKPNLTKLREPAHQLTHVSLPSVDLIWLLDEIKRLHKANEDLREDAAWEPSTLNH